MTDSDHRGRINEEYENVESVRLWGFEGIDTQSYYIQVRTKAGSQDAEITKDEFDRVEGLLKRDDALPACPVCGYKWTVQPMPETDDFEHSDECIEKWYSEDE